MTVAEIKAAVRERDGHCCTECGATDEQHRAVFGTGLQVHRVTPGSAYAVDDSCVTLCIWCHGPKPRRRRGTNPNHFTAKVPQEYRDVLRLEAIRRHISIGEVVMALIEQHLPESLTTIRDWHAAARRNPPDAGPAPGHKPRKP